MKHKDTIFNIEVIDIDKGLTGVIKDRNYCAYRDFEDSVLDTFVFRGYDLEESHVTGTEDSKTQYHTYVKIEEDIELKITVILRVSDDFKRLTQECNNQKRSDKVRNIYIIFNDDKFTSYEAALRCIEATLEEFEE